MIGGSLAAMLLLLAFDKDQPAPQAASLSSLQKQAEEARVAGRASDAEDFYKRALKLKPTWKEGWWSLGTLYYTQDQYAGCRESMSHLIFLEPNGAPGWTILGLCDFGAKEYDEALQHLRRGQGIGLGGNDKIDRVAKYHLGMLLTRGEAYEDALAMFYSLAHAGDDDGATIEAAGTAALRKPMLPDQLPASDRELVYLAGKAFWDVSGAHVTQAEKEFEALVTKYPKVPNVHYFYGSFLLANDPDRGLAEMEKELSLSPGHVPAMVAIAVEHLRRGESSKARPFALDAVRAMPESFAAHTVLGRVLVEQGETEHGIAELENAERLSPESPQPRIALASAYVKVGRNADAARERREFMRLKAPSKISGEK